MENIFEIIFATGISYIGTLKEETDEYFHFVDVLRTMSTPLPLDKDGKKSLTFMATMLPYRVIGEKSEMKINKSNPILLTVQKVTLMKYIQMYLDSIKKYNELYVNAGLDANNIVEGVVS